jgi:hypothetical protein
MYVKYVNSFDLSLPNQCQIGMFNLIKAWSFWLPFFFYLSLLTKWPIDT